MGPRATLVAFLVLAAPLPAAAQGVTVEKKDCKAGVHLVARNAKASEVLLELAKQLHFELKIEGALDRPVDADMTRRAPQLVAKLFKSDNVIYDEVPDPECPGKMRLSKVWVLPRGHDGPPAPTPHAMTPMEMYRKAHGLPPEEDDKPAAREPARDEAR
jgi:hypothetical protein